MRGFRRVMLIAAMVGAIGAVGLAGQAAAQSYASILSATVVNCSSVTVTGTDWEENADVTIFISSDPTRLGEVETDDEGSFTVTFPLNPGLGDGDHVLTAVSEFSQSSLGITLTGCGAGRLAVTGSNSFPYAAVGVGLILVGAVLAMITYRRRSAHINV